MIWRVEVKQKDGILDSIGKSVTRDIIDLGFHVSQVQVVAVFLLEGNISREEVKRIGDELLIDPIVEQYSFDLKLPLQSATHHVVEIAYNPGVMDPVEASTVKGIRDLGIKGIAGVKAEYDGLYVPPGVHEFRVTVGAPSGQRTSNTVSADLVAKKHFTLKVELRPLPAGAMAAGTHRKAVS